MTSPAATRSPRFSGGPGLGSRRNSLRALEHGALDVYEEERSVRSNIGGRLGGSIRTSSQASLRSYVYGEEGGGGPAGEGTPLMRGKEGLLLEEEEELPAPALLVWIFPALACAAAYAFYNIFIKKGSYTIHPILGGVVLQFVAAILGSSLLAGLYFFGDDASEIHYDRKGLMWSCWAGLAVGTAEMLSFCVSGMGVPATQSIPIIIGGSVLFGAVLGLLILHEVLMLHGWSGVAMLVVGIGLVATDPGDKVEEGGGDADDDGEAPPLLLWIVPALVCASAYAFYNIFIKKGSASINPILGGVVLQFVAALFGTALLGVLTLYEGGVSYLNCDRAGLLWACCAGVAVGAAEMISFCVSGLGVPATQSIPTIIGGSVMFGAVLGLIMLGETLMLQGWLGVLLLMTGIGFVATDPGEKVAGH